MKSAETPNLTPPEIIPIEPRDIAPRILGKYAVEAHDKAVFHDFAHDRFERIEDRAAQLQAEKVDPRKVGFVRRTIAKGRGNLMTPEELHFVRGGSNHDRNKRYEKHDAGYAQEDRDNYLKQVRGKLSRDFDLFDNLAFSLYCGSAPKWFQEVKDRQAPKVSWKDWLSTEASDEYLTNFLQWHTHSIEEYQSRPESQQQIELIRQQYKAGVTKGVKEGWLHPDAQKTTAIVDTVKVHKGDILQTLMADSRGHYIRGTDYVTVDSFRPKLVKHELSHRFKFGEGKPRWRIEAEVEQIAQVLNYGEPDIMDPGQRANQEDISYTDELSLYADVLRKGSEVVPVPLATRAASESLESSEAKDELEAAVNEAWSHYLPEGASVFKLLDKRIHTLKEHFEAEGKDSSEAELLAIQKTHDNLLKRPELIFGFNKKDRELSSARSQIDASIAELAPILLKILAGSQGTVTESKPPRSMVAQEFVAGIDAEVKELRAEGKSEKTAYKTLAKKYHSDVNDNPVAGEKMRVVTERIDRLNHAEGQRSKQAETSNTEKAAA